MYYKLCLVSSNEKCFVVAVLRPPFWKFKTKIFGLVLKSCLKVPKSCRKVKTVRRWTTPRWNLSMNFRKCRRKSLMRRWPGEPKKSLRLAKKSFCIKIASGGDLHFQKRFSRDAMPEKNLKWLKQEKSISWRNQDTIDIKMHSHKPVFRYLFSIHTSS